MIENFLDMCYNLSILFYVTIYNLLSLQSSGKCDYAWALGCSYQKNNSTSVDIQFHNSSQKRQHLTLVVDNRDSDGTFSHGLVSATYCSHFMHFTRSLAWKLRAVPMLIGFSCSWKLMEVNHSTSRVR